MGIFITETSDDRVTPVHARKMAARMEQQGHSVLLYENTDGGHAAGQRDVPQGRVVAIKLPDTLHPDRLVHARGPRGVGCAAGRAR